MNSPFFQSQPPLIFDKVPGIAYRPEFYKQNRAKILQELKTYFKKSSTESANDPLQPCIYYRFVHALCQLIDNCNYDTSKVVAAQKNLLEEISTLNTSIIALGTRINEGEKYSIHHAISLLYSVGCLVADKVHLIDASLEHGISELKESLKLDRKARRQTGCYL